MKEIKIVIGANYGDEGKGLATNFFSKKAKKQNRNTIVVLHNGGFQRGHTVIKDNIRHVFHCFSSGTFQNVPTYYASTFILNPMFFREEYEKMKKLGYEPIIFTNPSCKISTPYDVMINQIVETSRGEKRHGSCGYGIFETIKRNSKLPFMLSDYIKHGENLITSLMFEIRENYLFNRLEELGVKNVAINDLKNIFNNDIIAKYLEDLKFMISHLQIKETVFLDSFDEIIFEGSQGLMLDQSNIGSTAHLTPSNTGIKNPYDIIKYMKTFNMFEDIDVEVCYITRTYLTRHGSGEFCQECEKEKINKDMFDKTNVHNNFQGTIRYGYIDLSELIERIEKDSNFVNWRKCLFVTHLNETDGKFFTKNGKDTDVKTFKYVKYISETEEKVEEL